jgi:glucose/arabinose dehydrogenase
MKKLFYSLSALLMLGIAIYLYKIYFIISPEDIRVKNRFIAHCSGCHNEKSNWFVERDWLFGKEKEDIFNSIKYGRVAYGMPAFEQGLSDDEIKDLAAYVLELDTKVVNEDVLNNLPINVIQSEVQKFIVEDVITDLEVPWGIEFLPNGELLISERKGELIRLTKDKEKLYVRGLPQIFAKGQGGLMDLELHPEYKKNGWLYLAYSSPNKEDSTIANTAIMRARIKNNKLVNNEIIFKAIPDTKVRRHWGCRMEFDKEGYLYFSVGDRGNRDDNPQSLNNHCGKIHRIHDDGSIPEDNPFVNVPGAMPSIYTYGHRNPQGVCMHPITGQIWTDEHGPKGGDEINIIEKGKNYGWPVISFGINYDGTLFTTDTAKVGMEQPVLYWVPSIAPCGMTFVKGDRYPNWKNNILTGSLRFEYLHRVVLDGEKVVHQEKLLEDIGRVRNVEMSSDGFIYVAIEKPGKIVKLIPQL